MTELGDVDFGLTSKLATDNGQMRLTLLPYTLDYYKGMDPEYAWPEHITTDDNGHPVLPMSGLINSADFCMT